MQAILDAFGVYIVTDGTGTPKTRKEYTTDVRLYLEFAEAKGLDPYTTTTVRAYIHSLEGIRANSTRNRKIAALKKFSRFLSDDPYDKGFAKNIGRVKQETTIPDVKSQEQMSTLLDSIADPFYKALFEAYYATGARFSEIILSRMSQLNTVDRAIRIMGKGRKERWVFFTDAAWESFEEWLTIRDRSGVESEYIFCNISGEKVGCPPVHSTVWRRMKAYGMVVGIDISGIHNTRRAACTHLLENDANLEAVSEIMGHANISTTKGYAKLSTVALQRTVTTLHPRSKRHADV